MTAARRVYTTRLVITTVISFVELANVSRLGSIGLLLFVCRVYKKFQHDLSKSDDLSDNVEPVKVQ